MKKFDIKRLNFARLGGILPVIVQDAKTKTVLMLGFMNKEALEKTIKTKEVTFWSRTRKKLWEKGETSGNKLKLISISADCDNDTLLLLSKPQGPICHTGRYSCFDIEKQIGFEFLQELYDLILARKKKLPKNSYTTSLFKEGLAKILAKIEEESLEVLQAAQKEKRKRLIEESSDLLYHLLVLFVEKNISLVDIIQELQKRKKNFDTAKISKKS